MHDGYLTLDERAADTLTEWRSDPRKSQITIRELLNQSSGLDPQGGLPADDAYRAAINAPAIHEPGTTFDYGPNHFSAFAALLQRKLRIHGFSGDVCSTTCEHACWTGSAPVSPVGTATSAVIPCSRAAPTSAPPSGSSSGVSSPRRERGNHHEVLDPALIDQMLTPSAANPNYGLGWWLDPGPEEDQSGPIPGVPEDLVMAAGAGDQRLYVVRSRDLVVVRFGEDESFEDREFLRRLFAAAPR